LAGLVASSDRGGSNAGAGRIRASLPGLDSTAGDGHGGFSTCRGSFGGVDYFGATTIAHSEKRSTRSGLARQLDRGIAAKPIKLGGRHSAWACAHGAEAGQIRLSGSCGSRRQRRFLRYRSRALIHGLALKLDAARTARLLRCGLAPCLPQPIELH